MNRFFYPAIFHKDEKDGYWITFPDFPECFTQGKDLNDSYKMAIEALGLCIDERLRNQDCLPISWECLPLLVPTAAHST